jgi:hypothetical protein
LYVRSFGIVGGAGDGVVDPFDASADFDDAVADASAVGQINAE